MPSPHSKKNSIKWYQQPVSDVLNQALQFVVSALFAVGARALGYMKNPVALALTVMIPLLVLACHRAAVARMSAKQPPHLREILDELASIRIPTGKVVPNHADTKLLYVKYTPKDTWAVYLLDIASKQSRLVREVVNGKGSSEYTVNNNVKILGWSPRDEYFAYARNGRKEIAICDGDSGAELGKGNISVATSAEKGKSNGKKKKAALIRVKPISASTWLSSRALLCSDGEQIVEFSQLPKGWERTLFYQTPQLANGTNAAIAGKLSPPPVKLPAPKITAKKTTGTSPKLPVAREIANTVTQPIAPPVGEIKSLAAWDWNSAVWQQSNAIYVRERAGALKLLWQATNSTLLDFSFSSKAGKFLLHCQDEKGEFLVDYYPQSLAGKDAFTNEVRLDASEYKPTEVQLINNGEGYAYLGQDNTGLNQLIIKPTRSRLPVELPWQDEIRGFSINNLQLYAVTASADEPPGIWRCNLLSGDAECLVPGKEQPFKYAAHAPVIQGYITNTAGERLTYYFLEPTKPNGNQKHPLVVGIMGIGEPGYTWDRLAQTIANCGGYFVCMDRRKRNSGNWANDALCATEYLSKNFAVDTNNVYLLGISAGAYTASSLLESNPGLWKGAFLFSMQSFPSLDQMQAHSIALDVGDLDIKKVKDRLLLSQDKLAAAGIRPILMIHPNAGHIVRSIRLERERMEQIAAFIRQP